MNLLEYIKEKKLFDSIRIDDIQSNYKTVKDTLKKTNIEIDNTLSISSKNTLILLTLQ